MGLDHGLVRGKLRRPSDNDSKKSWNDFYAGKNHGELITWRKENHLHAWFVKNVQNGVDDCGYYLVRMSQLLRLHDTALRVLASSKLVPGTVVNGQTWTLKTGWVDNESQGWVIEDTTVAELLLPRKSGFFFGGTNYDQWYYRNLEHLVEVLESELRDAPDDTVWTYWSSW